MDIGIEERLCPACGSPCVTSIYEWVCLTSGCALRQINEL